MTLAQWIAALVAAVGVGISKAGFSGFSLLHVLIFAWLFGARGSTGIVLPLLIFGDVSAVRTFHTTRAVALHPPHAPAGLLGVVGAPGSCRDLSDAAYKPIMGWIILALATLHLLAERAAGAGSARAPLRGVRLGDGAGRRRYDA